MPSQHDQLFADQGLLLLFELHGEEITVTDPDGNSSTVTALLGKETFVEEETSRKRKSKGTRSAVFTTDASGHYGGIAAPNTSYTATIDSEVWEFDQIGEARGGFVNVTLVRQTAMEKSRPNFRGRM